MSAKSSRAGMKIMESSDDGLPKSVERPFRGSAQRSIVPVRRIFFCNSMTPYSSASAVGGQPGT